MLRRLKEMLIKEFLQMMRDPRMRMVIFGAPLIQLLIFAFALTTDVKNIKTAVLDDDNSASSREIISRFTSGEYFKIVGYVNNEKEMTAALDSGAAKAVIRFPRGFENDLNSGKSSSIQLIADGTFSNDVNIIFAYSNRIVRTYASEIQEENMIKKGISPPPEIKIQIRSWFNPNLESKFYYVTCLVAVMMMVISILLTSIAIVREKEIGTIEQIMVTPISRLEFILGKTIPYLITGYITMTLMFLVIYFVFGINIKGSILLLYIMGGVYISGNLGLALLISVSANTQQQALLTAFFILMPNVLLSGFMFPIRNMPEPIQYLTYINPMRWFLQILHGIIVKGGGAVSLASPIIAQTILAILFLTLASIRFRKTMG